MKEGSTCKQCRRGKLKRTETKQSFERDGVTVTIEGIPAVVCDDCGQVYYPPGVGNRVARAANELLALSDMKHAGGYRAAI